MTTTIEEKRFLTAYEVAAVLECSYEVVRQLVAEKRLRPVRLGSGPRARMRFERKEVERFIESSKRQSGRP